MHHLLGLYNCSVINIIYILYQGKLNEKEFIV